MKMTTFENTFMEETFLSEDGDAFASITIDGYPDIEDGDEGQVIAVVECTLHGDIVTFWKQREYACNETVKNLIAESVQTLKEMYAEGKPHRTAEDIAAEIKQNNIEVIDVLEELGYFQHILAGRDYVEGRIEVLIECGDVTVPEGTKHEDFVRELTDKVLDEGDFDAMNEKTESMEDADMELVDNIIALSIRS